MSPLPGRILLASALLLVAPAVLAQEPAYENDVRVRIGGYFPFDLPTKQGTMWGLEFRNMLTARDAVVYGVYLFDEQRTEISDIGVFGGPVTLHADIKIVPVLAGWARIFPRKETTYFAGLGAGFYPVQAFSGGFNSIRQFKDVGDFRFLEDDTLVGAFFFGGVDFLPDRRWGWSAEIRGHLVESGYSAIEGTVAGLFRF
jgi:hypothetical protein